MMTVCAGRLTPHARVAVVHSTCHITSRDFHQFSVHVCAKLEPEGVVTTAQQGELPAAVKNACLQLQKGLAHLQDAVAEQALHQVAVAAQHAGVVHPDAARNQLLQLPVHTALAWSEACPSSNNHSALTVQAWLSLPPQCDVPCMNELKTSRANFGSSGWRQQCRYDALVAGLFDVAADEGPLRVLRHIEDRGVAGVLRLLDDGAPRLAGVLARVHEHHGLVPRLQAVDHLHSWCFHCGSEALSMCVHRTYVEGAQAVMGWCYHGKVAPLRFSTLMCSMRTHDTTRNTM